MIVNGKPKSYSGQGSFWGNLLVTAVCFALFLGCLYAMGWWDFETVWVPGIAAMVLAVDELKQKAIASPLDEVYSAQNAFQTKVTALIETCQAECDRMQDGSV